MVLVAILNSHITYYRVVRPNKVVRYILLRDGDEIHFGVGTGGHQVTLPDPKICNLHLAICLTPAEPLEFLINFFGMKTMAICLTPAEPLEFLINFFGMKTMMDSKSLSTSVLRLYLMMY